MLKRTIIVLALCSFSELIFAQDRQFVETYQSTTLPQGVRDIEIWNTFSTGSTIYYKGLLQRLEFETGLTDHLQTSIYININTVATAANDTSAINTTTLVSVSSEWKLKLSNANTNAIGSAVYAELGISTQEFELETKVILDKNIGDEIFALNLVNEFEREFGRTPAGAQNENHPEVDFGYMHMIKPNLGIGLEFRENNTVSDNEGWEYSTLFGGPTIFYSGKSSSLVFNVLPQIQNFHKTQYEPGNIVSGDYQRWEVRLLFSFNGL